MLRCRRKSRLCFLVSITTCLFVMPFALHLIRRTSQTRLTIREGDRYGSLPLCTEGVLDRRKFAHDRNRWPLAMKPVTSRQDECRLHFYSKKDVAHCLDQSADSGLDFVFIGDSRVRQNFYKFIELIPNYEMGGHYSERHADFSAYSDLLNVTVSFYWKPFLDEDFISLTRQWATSPQAPYFVHIGFSTHYMMAMNGNDNRRYEKDLIKLWPILKEMNGRGTRIVWLNQDPPVEPFENRDFSTQKLEHYNEIALGIFRKNNVPVHVWDSANSLTEEYVRSCRVFPSRVGLELIAWMHCLDYLHAGNSATSQGIQLLFNDMCNRFFSL